MTWLTSPNLIIFQYSVLLKHFGRYHKGTKVRYPAIINPNLNRFHLNLDPNRSLNLNLDWLNLNQNLKLEEGVLLFAWRKPALEWNSLEWNREGHDHSLTLSSPDVAVPHPDKKSVIMYVTSLFQVLPQSITMEAIEEVETLPRAAAASITRVTTEEHYQIQTQQRFSQQVKHTRAHILNSAGFLKRTWTECCATVWIQTSLRKRSPSLHWEIYNRVSHACWLCNSHGFSVDRQIGLQQDQHRKHTVLLCQPVLEEWELRGEECWDLFDSLGTGFSQL